MRIALVSDTHLAARAAGFIANWRAVGDWLAAGDFDMALHLGDVTADGAGNPLEFGEALAIIGDIGLPIRVLPGNHDVGDNPPAPGVAPGETPVSQARLDDWRAAFGEDRFVFEVEGFLLIGLNAQRFGADLQDEQADWLAKTLARSSAPVGLFVHKPLFRNGRADREAHVRYMPAAAREPLLDAIGDRLRFVVSGHAHQKRIYSTDGVEHIWLPATAMVIPDEMQERIGEKAIGVAVLTLDSGRHSIEFVRPDGMVDISLSDCGDVYPQIVDIWREIRAAAAE